MTTPSLAITFPVVKNAITVAAPFSMAEGGPAMQPMADMAGGMREARAMSITPGETTIGASLTVTFEVV